MSKKRAVLLVVLTVLGNCLGNLSSDLLRSSGRSMSRLWANARHQYYKEHCLARDKEKTEHRASHT